jgi:CBS domain-containing protein
MIFKRNASDFMTSNVIVAGENNTFDQVMTFFTKHKIQHLPVADNNTLIGIISIKDMLSFMAVQIAQNPMISAEMLNANFDVKQVMTPDPVTVEPEASQKEILEILAAGKFQAVPVVRGGEIKGIITNKDITRIYHYDATHML